MDLDPASAAVQHIVEAPLDVVQHFAVHLEGLKHPLVGGLQGHLDKICSHYAPVRGVAATVRSAEEDDESASFLTGLGTGDGVLDDDATETVGDEQDRIGVVSENLSLNLD